MEIVQFQIYLFLRNVVQLLCFCGGACVASLMVGGHKKFNSGRHYSGVFGMIGVFVLVASSLEAAHSDIICWLIAFASGMQNGMTTYFSGAIVRTTHMTGTLTDIGIEAAGLLLRRSQSTWKIEILCCFVLGFFSGGCVGTICSLFFPRSAMYVAGFLYIIMAFVNDLYHTGSLCCASPVLSSRSVTNIVGSSSDRVGRPNETTELNLLRFAMPVTAARSLSPHRGRFPSGCSEESYASEDENWMEQHTLGVYPVPEEPPSFEVEIEGEVDFPAILANSFPASISKQTAAEQSSLV
jgi:uncharacterized membrane protein YoaK (UPF0700 family)